MEIYILDQPLAQRQQHHCLCRYHHMPYDHGQDERSQEHQTPLRRCDIPPP